MIFLIKRKIFSTGTFGKAYKGFFVFSILFLLLLSVFSYSYKNEPFLDIDNKVLNQKVEGVFKDVSVRELLIFLTSKIPYNFIVDVDEDKKISVSFKNTTLINALRNILTYAQLEAVKIDNKTVLITSSNKANIYKKRETVSVKLIYTPADYIKNIIYNNSKDVNILVDNFSNSLIIDSPIDKISHTLQLVKFFDKPDSELRTKVFKLNNAKSKDVLPIIVNSVYTFQDPVIKEQIKIDSDERTNSIVVTAPKFVLDNIEILLSDIVDKKVPQVMIDVQVLEVNKDKLKDLGLYPGENSTITTLTEQNPNSVNNSGAGGTTTDDTVVYVQSDKVAFPFRTSISLQLMMLEKKGMAKILANPKLTTSDGKIAKVFLGDRVPYIRPQVVPFGNTSAIQENVEFVDVGVNLEFQPSCTKDGYINLKINPKVSYLVKIDPAPWTATREVLTELTVKSNDIIVIAGLIREEERKTNYKIPIIGDIPLVGSLFRAEKKSKQDTEVIFVIKPQIISLPNDTISN